MTLSNRPWNFHVIFYKCFRGITAFPDFTYIV
jgi:hypothetical protein